MKTVEDRMAALEQGLFVVQEWISAGMTDEEIEARLVSYQASLLTFTGDWMLGISLRPRRKFGKTWRELLEISVGMLHHMRRWADLGYTAVSFAYRNTECRPVRIENIATDLGVRVLPIGMWEALDKMVSCYCHNGVIEDPLEGVV